MAYIHMDVFVCVINTSSSLPPYALLIGHRSFARRCAHNATESCTLHGIKICHARNSLDSAEGTNQNKNSEIKAKWTVHLFKINYMLLIFCVKFAVLSQCGKWSGKVKEAKAGRF